MFHALPLGPGSPLSPLSEAARLAAKRKNKADFYKRYFNTCDFTLFKVNMILNTFKKGITKSTMGYRMYSYTEEASVNVQLSYSVFTVLMLYKGITKTLDEIY